MIVHHSSKCSLSSLNHARAIGDRPSQLSRARRSTSTVKASTSHNDPAPSRREALISAGFAAGLPLLLNAPAVHAGQQKISVSNLSVFQKSAQLKFLGERAQLELKKVLTAADRPTAWRLIFNDAASFNAQTGMGGVNGSIVLDAELNRKANQGLRPYVDKLRKAKKTIDARGAEEGQAPISWADLMVLAAKVTTVLEWSDIKNQRNPNAGGGLSIATLFGAEWQLQLGREDATKPDPEVSIPTVDSSVDEIRDFLYQLGNKTPGGGLGSFFSGKPPFYERPGFVVWTYAQPDSAKAEAKLGADPRFSSYKAQYDRSRETLTRAEYEVDTIQYFNELSLLGAKLDRNKYYFDVTVDVPDIR